MSSLLNNGRARRYMGGVQNGVRAIPLVVAMTAVGYLLVAGINAPGLPAFGGIGRGVLVGSLADANQSGREQLKTATASKKVVASRECLAHLMGQRSQCSGWVSTPLAGYAPGALASGRDGP